MDKGSDSLYSVIVGGGVATFVYLMGGVDQLFIACTLFVILDFITGVTAAAYLRELRSRIAWWGLARKGISLTLVIVANQLDIIAGNSDHFMRSAMLLFIVATEGLSIFENLGKLGVKSPKFVMEYLRAIRDGIGKK
jgi:toxin secretion/phage lysis holin